VLGIASPTSPSGKNQLRAFDWSLLCDGPPVNRRRAPPRYLISHCRALFWKGSPHPTATSFTCQLPPKQGVRVPFHPLEDRILNCPSRRVNLSLDPLPSLGPAAQLHAKTLDREKNGSRALNTRLQTPFLQKKHTTSDDIRRHQTLPYST
jgi:hypothetical protein